MLQIQGYIAIFKVEAKKNSDCYYYPTFEFDSMMLVIDNSTKNVNLKLGIQVTHGNPKTRSCHGNLAHTHTH